MTTGEALRAILMVPLLVLVLLASVLAFIAILGLEGKEWPVMGEERIFGKPLARRLCRIFYFVPIFSSGGLFAFHES